MMREKKFREAFGISIYRPALEGLSAQEFEDLRPDFERVAIAIIEKIPEKIGDHRRTDQWGYRHGFCENARCRWERKGRACYGD